MGVLAVDVLLRRLMSVVRVETVAVLPIVLPSGVVVATRTITVNVADAPEVSVAMVPLIVPVPPTGGLVRVNAGPDVCVSETKVVLAGRMSDSNTVWASLGPALATVIV